MSVNEENCVRKRVQVGGENYYIIVGKKFINATIPRENDPVMTKNREIVETICETVTELMNHGSKI